MSSVRVGKRGDTRAAILDAARGLFESNGYHSVGLEIVAAKAGVSRQAIYLHFDSKTALLEALHERINDLDVVPVMSKVWDAPDASAALDAFVKATAVSASNIAAIYTALEAAGRTDPVVAGSMRLGSKRRYADCMRLAKWLDVDKLLAPEVDRRYAADVIWTIANIPTFSLLTVDRGWSRARWTVWATATLHSTLVAA